MINLYLSLFLLAVRFRLWSESFERAVLVLYEGTIQYRDKRWGVEVAWSKTEEYLTWRLDHGRKTRAWALRGPLVRVL